MVVAALGFAVAGSSHPNRVENYVVPSFACNTLISSSIVEFPNNGKQNEVDLQVKTDGVTTQTVAVKFFGSSPNPNPWKSTVTAIAGHTYEVIATWGTNGVSGHIDVTSKATNCSTVTTTTTPTTTTPSTTTSPAPPVVTTSPPVTTTTPVVVPPPLSTTTVTTTSLIPAVPAKPKPPTVVIKRLKAKPVVCKAPLKKLKGSTTTCVKTITVVKKVTIKAKPHLLTPAELCVSVKDNNWINGVCSGVGRG